MWRWQRVKDNHAIPFIYKITSWVIGAHLISLLLPIRYSSFAPVHTRALPSHAILFLPEQTKSTPLTPRKVSAHKKPQPQVIKKVQPKKVPVTKTAQKAPEKTKALPEKKITTVQKKVVTIPEPKKTTVAVAPQKTAPPSKPVVPQKIAPAPTAAAVIKKTEPPVAAPIISAQQLKAYHEELENALVGELGKTWQPPQGFNAQASCSYKLEISKSGTLEKATLVQSSGILVYDVAARSAIFKMTRYPLWSHGKEVIVTFR